MTDTSQEPAVLPHPAAVLPDGADIRFVSFVRRLPDGSMKHAPVDFLAEEMLTWDQVVDLWGGGEYQAIAKNQKHQVLGHYPPRGKWMAFAGEPKPMVKPPCPPRLLPVDDPHTPILPPAVLPQPPVRGSIATTALAASAPASGEAQSVWIREVELGERVGLRNPFDIRPRIGRLIREGVLSELGLTRTAEGGYLLSREAAVLITLRLKLKRSVRLEVVGALLAGAQRPHPAPLAPSAPPIMLNGEGRTASAPFSPPPIVLNGEGNEVLLGEHRIPLHFFRGAMVMVARDFDGPLDYEAGVIAQQLTSVWADEVQEGVHFTVLKGADLREFKANAALTRTNLVSAHTKSLTILTEAGIDRVCLLTKKPAGVRLRAFIADHVLPKLRRGEPVGTGGAGGTQVPLVSAVAPNTSGPARPSPADTPKFHPVLVDRLDETSRRLAAVEDRGRQIEARLGDLEARLSGSPPSGPWLA